MRYLFILAAIVCCFSSCLKLEEDLIDTGFSLEFSVDTLRFDTVFTELGSATRSMKVYNRQDQRISINKIRLANNEAAKFRLNVDGIPEEEFTNVEIPANDSIYIFAEVTIDPDAPLSESPFVIESNIIFEVGDGQQSVLLEAWGQNANYIPNRFGKETVYLLPCEMGELTWDDPKPYVIYGHMFVDNCDWRLAPGTRVHVHGGPIINSNGQLDQDGRIIVLPNASLRCEGTLEEPVIIQGDRLEEDFLEIAGQWSGIILANGSRGNTFDHTTVRNSTIGVFVDSTANFVARNSQFYNTAAYGVRGRHSRITMQNCLVYNNFSSSSAVLDFGGDYNFTYCTFANYGVDANALSISNFFCYERGSLNECLSGLSYRLNARFKNCIFAGSKREQVSAFDVTDGTDPNLFNYQFENCLVRYDELEENIPYFESSFVDVARISSSLDTLFVSTSDDDYHLDSLSIAEGLAAPVPNILTDLEGNERDAETPDLGCYEYQY